MTNEDKKPWWKFGYVWMVLGGPLAVIIASIFTVYYAIETPDPAIENYYVKGIHINETLANEAESLAPAIKARNHAATGVKAP